jgi:UDP-arabinose 4-epimerase
VGHNVLVTGGAGYIGSHACKALAAAGHVPIVYDNLVHGHRWAVRWGSFVEGDIGNKGKLSHTLREYQIDTVMHFAGYAYVGESMCEPGRYFRNNVINSLQVLDAMLQTGVRHIVFSSSCSTYGTPQAVPIDEGQIQCPVNPYGESKLFVERALHWYEAAHGLRFAVLRYFNAAGADPQGEIGEDHEPETHLIPLAIQAALGQRSHLDIYGTDYVTPDGTAVRDYIHVSDLALAHVRALEYLHLSATSLAVNLGTGRGHSVREVIAAVERVSGLSVPVRNTLRRDGDPPQLIAGCGRASALLNWQPRYPDLESIVESAWHWHSRHASAARTATAVATV